MDNFTANASTESLICTQYLSLPGRDSAPASPMSSTFFDANLIARSISPVPSNYAVYTRSRPTSTGSSVLDFQSFSPLPTTRLDAAVVNTSLINQIASDLDVGERCLSNQKSSPLDDKASLTSKQTTRSKAVRRSDVVEPITEGGQERRDGVPDIQEQVEKKGRKFLPKFFRRALSSSGALNAQILDRNTVPTKLEPCPLAPSGRANTTPAFVHSSVSKGKGKAHSVFRFRQKGDLSPSKPVHTPPPFVLADDTAQRAERRRQVRRSGSFAGFSTVTLAPASPLIFQREGLFSNTYTHPIHAVVDGDEDELDPLTLEATTLSAHIGQVWAYAEDEI
ncbi:hypothetical protein J3R30DRAFT_3539506 [Lentinula aciculospora]|uniref:Uncharacterized protein n=1 Tax=Lentinula aciculospora TaxID=153920 RepID=A0A9W9A0K4_9AGAR|nr:hypothetical protein J3R30DRAFT_3539506 [Lentinula aciculospora]